MVDTPLTNDPVQAPSHEPSGVKGAVKEAATSERKLSGGMKNQIAKGVFWGAVAAAGALFGHVRNLPPPQDNAYKDALAAQQAKVDADEKAKNGHTLTAQERRERAMASTLSNLKKEGVVPESAKTVADIPKPAHVSEAKPRDTSLHKGLGQTDFPPAAPWAALTLAGGLLVNSFVRKFTKKTAGGDGFGLRSFVYDFHPQQALLNDQNRELAGATKSALDLAGKPETLKEAHEAVNHALQAAERGPSWFAALRFGAYADAKPGTIYKIGAEMDAAGAAKVKVVPDRGLVPSDPEAARFDVRNFLQYFNGSKPGSNGPGSGTP